MFAPVVVKIAVFTLLVALLWVMPGIFPSVRAVIWFDVFVSPAYSDP